MAVNIVVDGQAPSWAHALARDVALALDARTVPTRSVSNLPPARPAGRIIFIPDESGGAVLAFSDGTAWRRSTDRAVVS